MANLGLLIAISYHLHLSFSFSTFLSHLSWSLTLSLIWLVFASAFDCYDLKHASQAYRSLLCIEKALLATSLAFIFAPYISPSRLLTAYFLFSSSALLAIWRLCYVAILGQPRFKRRAIVVGAGWAGRTIARAVQENLDSDYQLVGYIDDDSQKRRQIIEGVSVLGNREDLVSLLETTGADEIILAITHNLHEDLFRAIMECYERGAKLSLMPILYERITGRVPVEHVGPNWHVTLPEGSPSAARVNAFLRRSLDLALSLVGLAILGVFLPFIALALYLESPGPIFCTEERVGRGGKIFHFIRFRESRGWVGTGLRLTLLDKLPQLINVLRGEMSLVGPHGESPEALASLERQIPFHRARHAVRPGLTGWAQINYRYGSPVRDALTELQYDLYYIKHQSVYLDFHILLKTLGAFFKFTASHRLRSR